MRSSLVRGAFLASRSTARSSSSYAFSRCCCSFGQYRGPPSADRPALAVPDFDGLRNLRLHPWPAIELPHPVQGLRKAGQNGSATALFVLPAQYRKAATSKHSGLFREVSNTIESSKPLHLPSTLRSVRTFLFLIFVVWMLSPGAQAQSIPALLAAASPASQVSGRIYGTVTDSAGNVVPAAHVTLQHDGAKQPRELVTGGGGFFNFTGLGPGTYRIEVAAAGFAPWSGVRIVLAPGELPRNSGDRTTDRGSKHNRPGNCSHVRNSGRADAPGGEAAGARRGSQLLRQLCLECGAA